MTKKYYVYIHKTINTGRIFYIGKGHGNRLNSKSGRSRYWKNTVEKNGGFSAHIVIDGLSENKAFAVEKKIISRIGRHRLCNLTDGGDGPSGYRHTEETKELLRSQSIAQFSCEVARKEHSARERKKWECEETRKKMSDSLKLFYEKNPDVLGRMSEAMLEVWDRPGFKESWIKTRRQIWGSDEMREKISKAQKKRFENPEEMAKHRARQKKLRKAVHCVTNGKTYESQAEAARDLGIEQGGISQCVTGRLKRYKGYEFAGVGNDKT